MTSNINLANLQSYQGFKIVGDPKQETYRGAGDVNNDGYDDIIIGGTNTSYVLFGSKNMNFLNQNSVTLSNLEPQYGFKIYDISSSSNSKVVSGAGDVNNDGYDDIIIGETTTATVYVLYGNATNNLTDIHLQNITSSHRGFKIIGSESECFGCSVSGVGDTTKGGYGDIIIGAQCRTETSYGSVYVVYGGLANFKDVNVDSLVQSQGYKITGSNKGDYFGWSVAGVGDFNKVDGFNDIIIGSAWYPNYYTSSGASYVIYGANKDSRPSVLSISSLSVTQGFAIYGANNNDFSGYSVSGAGDINGDGLADVIIGAYNAYRGNDDRPGKSYVIYGIQGYSTQNMYLSTIQSSELGYVINGINNLDSLGLRVSSAGDYNKDGYADILIEAPVANSGSGVAYLVYGNATKYFGTISNLDNMYSLNKGFAIFGINGQGGVNSIASLGDINEDGFDDVLVGQGANSNNPAGKDYVIYGGVGVPTGAPTKTPSIIPTKSPSFGPSQSPTNVPSLSPSFIPTSSPSPIPTQIPSIIPTVYPSINPSLSPTFSPTIAPSFSPTISPTPKYIIIEVTSGGTYSGTAANEEFIIDSAANTVINGGGGSDEFTILPHENIVTTITDFNSSDDIINLSAFDTIYSISDLDIVYTSKTAINLPNKEQINLSNLAKVTSANFVFASVNTLVPTSSPNKDPSPSGVSSEVIGIIAGVVPGVALLGLGLTSKYICVAAFDRWNYGKPEALPDQYMKNLVLYPCKLAYKASYIQIMRDREYQETANSPRGEDSHRSFDSKPTQVLLVNDIIYDNPLLNKIFQHKYLTKESISQLLEFNKQASIPEQSSDDVSSSFVSLLSKPIVQAVSAQGINYGANVITANFVLEQKAGLMSQDQITSFDTIKYCGATMLAHTLPTFATCALTTLIFQDVSCSVSSYLVMNKAVSGMSDCYEIYKAAGNEPFIENGFNFASQMLIEAAEYISQIAGEVQSTEVG